ncbi:superoxide dismutase [Bdellovibrio sp. qaytius]|nr:superoxide dismutase [Bdellovibrio sp. qaytius]
MSSVRSFIFSRGFMKTIKLSFVATLLCASNAYCKVAASSTATINEKLTAELMSKNGSQVSGQIDFTQEGNQVKVTYKIKNLANKQSFGLHIHEKPDCSSADGKSAGGHYSKMAGHEGHGTSLDFPDLYAGDLPQITSNGNGVAEGSFLASHISISGGTSNTVSIMDRAIIVHGGPDDKTKKSSPRIACGVIKSVVK